MSYAKYDYNYRKEHDNIFIILFLNGPFPASFSFFLFFWIAIDRYYV